MTVRAFAGERIYYYNCHRNGGNDFAWYSNNLPGGITSEIITSDSNPFLDHLWLSISVQFSSKMKMRNVPILPQHYAKTSQVPETMALAFAAFILFMKTKQTGENKYEGHANGKSYIVQDDNVALFAEAK